LRATIGAQLELREAGRFTRRADHAAGMANHERETGLVCMLRGDDQIAFILALFVVDHHDETAVPKPRNGVAHARQSLLHVRSVLCRVASGGLFKICEC
jgi:hypothetical protein